MPDIFWTALFGIFTIVIFVLLLSICCCQCFLKFKLKCPCNRTRSRDGRSRDSRTRGNGRNTARVGSIEIATVEGSNMDHMNRHPVVNPLHEFTFNPPDYETVCKDLPKYEDVIAAQRAGVIASQEPGLSNNAFILDDEGHSRTRIRRDNIDVERGSLGLPQNSPPPSPPPPPY